MPSRRVAADAVQRQTQEVPLLGTRRHYLRLDSDEVLLTRRWTQSVDDHDDNDGSGALPADASDCPPLSNALASRDARPPAAQSSAVRVLSGNAAAPAPANLPRAPGTRPRWPPPVQGRRAHAGGSREARWPLNSHGGLHEQTPWLIRCISRFGCGMARRRAGCPSRCGTGGARTSTPSSAAPASSPSLGTP